VTKTSLIAVAITAAMAIPAYAKPKMKDQLDGLDFARAPRAREVKAVGGVGSARS
jgi:hypothetical protein